MQQIVYEGWDSENERLVLVTDQGEVLHIKNCVCDDEPVPDPEPEAYDLEWDAYMQSDGFFAKVTERFELLEGRFEPGQITFHFRTLADKMSMQGGLLVLVPANFGEIPDMGLVGVGTLNSPRKPEFSEKAIESRWAKGPSNMDSLVFMVDGQFVEGSATTSAGDVPWNWHYGLEIVGVIPV